MRRAQRSSRDAEYEENERRIFNRDMREAESGSVAERRESCMEAFEIMRDDPDRVAERVSWLLDGTMGYGAMQAARRIASNPRMNRVAALTQIVGALEYKCPQPMFIRAWKKLSTEQKARLNRAVERELREHLAQRANGTSGDRSRRRATSRRDTYPSLKDRYPGHRARTRPRSRPRSR